MPTSTDLVTDLPADFETFGQAVDTSLAELKGGTTGQVLSKTSNTDMDFTWVTSDDANAIQNTIVDAKGDLIAASASDVPARLAVGNNGETLVADSSTTTGLRYNPTSAAGKNPVINGGFDIWQRGTSTTDYNGPGKFLADRWQIFSGTTGRTFSRQATGDTTNLPFIQYAIRLQRNSGNTATEFLAMGQSMETTTFYPFSGRTVTLSFYARKGANFSGTFVGRLVTGTGTDENGFYTGYTGTATPLEITPTLTTTWQRFTITGNVGSTMTEGATNFTTGTLSGTAGAADWVEVTGVQLELGSTATTFSRAGGTIQGELAACQRYYWRNSSNATANFASFGTGLTQSATAVICSFINPVPMRVAATSVDFSTLNWNDGTNTSTITAMTVNAGNSNTLITSTAATTTFGTQYRPVTIQPNNSSTAFIGFSAEL